MISHSYWSASACTTIVVSLYCWSPQTTVAKEDFVAMKSTMLKLVTVACAAAMAFATVVSSAQADSLADQKAQADAGVNQAQTNVNNAQANLNAANERVRDAQVRLANAQDQLAAAQQVWNQAQDVAAAKAKELYEAQQGLAAAQQKVADGEAKIDAQKDAINAYARAIVQENMPMINVAVLINAHSTASLANRVQWSDTVLNTNQVDLDQLRVIQAELVDAQTQAQQAQEAADKAEQEAEEQCAIAQAAQEAAEKAQDEVAAALAEEQNAQAAAAQTLSNGQAQLAAAQATQADIDNQIAEANRIAEENRRAEAARQAAAANQTSGGSTGGGSSSGGGSLSPAEAQATAYGMIQAYGWGDSQFSCLVKLWTRESGWRWWAENPSSGAYGIPQSLPASKMAASGADYRTNAVTQMRWGLSYISSRYGTPCSAWAHSEATNWY